MLENMLTCPRLGNQAFYRQAAQSEQRFIQATKTAWIFDKN